MTKPGVLDIDNHLPIEPVGNMLEEAEHIRRHKYNKESFRRKLDEMRDINAIIPPGLILDKGLPYSIFIIRRRRYTTD